jgi:hypothetical protein
MGRTCLIAAAMVGALAASGCGSADRAPTLAQFAARANAVCENLTRQQSAIVDRAGTGRLTPASAALVWREVEVVSRQADVEVKDLARPPAQATVIGELVDKYFREADDEIRIADAYQHEGVASGQARERLSGPLTVGDAEIARGLGMTACAKAPPPETVAPERL